MPVVVLASVLVVTWRQAPISTVGAVSFSQPLRIPPVAPTTVDPDGTRVVPLRIQEGQTPFKDGERTATWGIDGSYLGPTVRARRGERVRMEVTSAVPEPTSLHWHGMRLPASADGGPHQMIDPGSTWSPSWTIDQPAATLWYHPHLHGATADQVQRGAAGLFLVDDPATAGPDLPARYGVDDIPVVVQDRAFDDRNQFEARQPFLDQVGILGDEIVVNGTLGPYLDVTTERVRLRVLNASNARIYTFALADHRAFDLVGTDGGILRAPVPSTEIPLSPGERAEIVVSVRPGERVVLRSEAAKLDVGFFGRTNGADDTFDVLELRAASVLQPSPAVPDRLVPFDPPSVDEADETRTFRLGSDAINGREMDPARIDDAVTAGSVEVWEVTNGDAMPHSFHPHLVHFAVLDVGGAEPPPRLRGWKDTVYVPPNTTVRIIARFDGEPDPDTPFMFHCHILRHEDEGMMGQFVLVAPGQEAADRIEVPVGGAGHQGHGG